MCDIIFVFRTSTHLMSSSEGNLQTLTVTTQADCLPSFHKWKIWAGCFVGFFVGGGVVGGEVMFFISLLPFVSSETGNKG